MDQFWNSLGMMGLAVASVGLWTLRVALTARGRKVAGSVSAAVEALVFLFAFSRVSSNIDALSLVAGYAAGVGLGTFLGLVVDEKLSTGQSEVRIVTLGDDPSLVSDLHALGWPVTSTAGTGPFGDVTVAFVVVDDVKIRSLTTEVERRRPDAFWTVEALRKTRAHPLGRGWIQVGGGFFHHPHHEHRSPNESQERVMA